MPEFIYQEESGLSQPSDCEGYIVFSVRRNNATEALFRKTPIMPCSCGPLSNVSIGQTSKFPYKARAAIGDGSRISACQSAHIEGQLNVSQPRATAWMEANCFLGSTSGNGPRNSDFCNVATRRRLRVCRDDRGRGFIRMWCTVTHGRQALRVATS